MFMVIASSDGVSVAGLLQDSVQDAWQIEWSALEGVACTSVAVQTGRIVVGTHAGIQRSADGGRTWEPASRGLSHQHVRWLAAHPDERRLFAGTEPAGIFVSDDGAASWRSSPEVESLRDEFAWFLPYSPEAGCVRGFAFQGSRAFAAVEVGGVLASGDGGPWELVPGSDGVPSFGEPRHGFVRPDVHSVETHPSQPDAVWVATDGGVFGSTDRGSTWGRLGEPLYTRALCLAPDSPLAMVAGPARSVGRGGTVKASADGGATWTEAAAGLEVPWPQAMVERFATVGDRLVAVMSDGRLLASRWPGRGPSEAKHATREWAAAFAWSRILPGLTGAEAVAAALAPPDAA